MRLITAGLPPAEFILLLNENFTELAQIREVEAFGTLTDETNIELMTAINTYFGAVIVSIGMTALSFVSSINNAFSTEAGSKSNTISAYQNSGDNVYIAGLPVSLWDYEAGHSIPENPTAQTTGFTIIERGHAVRQTGYIRSFDVPIYYLSNSNAWSFKVFRHNGTAYECLFSEAFTPTGTGDVSAVQTFTLNTPAYVEVGDILGLYIPLKNAVLTGRDPGKYGVEPRSENTNIAVGATAAFTTNANTIVDDSFLNVGYMYLAAYSNRPYAVLLGDSIFAAGNSHQITLDGREWKTDQEASLTAYQTPGGSPGDKELSTSYRLATKLPPAFRFQNFSRSGNSFATIVTGGRQLDRAVLSNPKAVIIHCGINDLLFVDGAPRTWENISADLDTIRAAFATGTLFYLDEILPSTNKTDEQCLLIRQTNANYAAYCTAHGWTLIPCHDEMGTIKVSTGLYDDINILYQRGDNLHLNQTGVDKLAEIISRYI